MMRSILPQRVPRLTTLLAAAGLTLGATCASLAQPVPVTGAAPRVVLPGFSIAPPAENGWLQITGDALAQLNQSSGRNYSLLFTKKLGENGSALLGVAAIPYPMELGDNKRRLDTLVATRSGAASSRERIVSSNVITVSIAGVECRRQDRVVADRGGGRLSSPMAIHERRLYCLHPDYPTLALIADDSERVESGMQPPNPEEGESFLQSLAFERLPRHITTIPVGSVTSERFDAVKGLAHTPGAIWVAYGSRMVARIDTSTNRVVATVRVGTTPTGAAVDGNNVWITNYADATVSRIDVATNRVVATVKVGRNPGFVAVGGGAVWVSNSGERSVSRIDPATNRVRRIDLEAVSPGAIAWAGGSVLVTDQAGDSLYRIDPQANVANRAFAIGARSGSLVTDGDQIWISYENGVIRRFDLADPTREFPRIEEGAGAGPIGLALAGRELWIANIENNTIGLVDLDRIDSGVRLMPGGGGPFFVIAAEDAIWVTTFSSTVLRLDKVN